MLVKKNKGINLWEMLPPPKIVAAESSLILNWVWRDLGGVWLTDTTRLVIDTLHNTFEQNIGRLVWKEIKIKVDWNYVADNYK